MKKKFLLFLITLTFTYCSKTKKEVIFDTSFLGARLDSIKKIDNNTYQAYTFPAFEPVNKSPWFAFGVSSPKEQTITLHLKYGKYKHRYIPKVSTDKKNWHTISKNQIKVDTVSGVATLQIKVSPQKKYIAAQEVFSSKDTYNWLDAMIKKHSFLQKEIAGKTVLNKNNYVVVSESKTKNAIVLIARQHPPEVPGGTLSFTAFFEELIGETELAKQFRKAYTIYTFPLLNPDGADMGNWRHNANGKDLNRDWVDFTQPETQTVKNYITSKINEGKKVKFGIDFHTSYSGPYLLVLDSINEQKTKKIIPKWIQNIETNSDFKVEARRRSQKLPYCYNWFFNTLNSEAVTYEEGDEIDRKIINQRAKTYANQLMKTLLTNTTNNEK